MGALNKLSHTQERGLKILVALECLVLAQAFFAYQDQFLTLTQMQQRGIDQGLPFIWHFGMWGDLLVISPLASFLIARYGTQWSAGTILSSLAIGTALSLALHYVFTLTTMPEAHVHNHKLTATGVTHLIYMTSTIAIFCQFILFTPHVLIRHSIFTSILLVAHVFCGTHMLLGLLKSRLDLRWYPAQPLHSVSGWLMISAVAIGLCWHNYRLLDRANAWDRLPTLPSKIPILAKFLAAFEFWTLQRFDTTERYLKFLDHLAGYVGYSAFLGVFLTRLEHSAPFKGGFLNIDNWTLFISAQALPCLLVLVNGIVYGLGKQSIRLELTYGPKLFPKGRAPDRWGSPKVRFNILLVVLGFLGSYLLLMWVADDILISSLIISILAWNDLNTRRLINAGIKNSFANPAFAPRPGEADKTIIDARRQAVCVFLFCHPHLLKEFCRSCGCTVAFGIAIFGYVTETNAANYAAYILLLTVLALNECVTVRWRVEVWRKMKELDKQAEAI